MTRELSVQTISRSAIGAVSGLCSRVCAKTVFYVIKSYFRVPSTCAAFTIYALVSGRIMRPDCGIAFVLTSCGLAQISPSVIIALAIAVIDLVLRPPSGNNKSYKTVFGNCASTYPNISIPKRFVHPSGALSGTPSVDSGVNVTPYFPYEMARGLDVSKRASNVACSQIVAKFCVMCDFGLSHLTLQRSLVRSPVRVASAWSGFAFMPYSAAEA